MNSVRRQTNMMKSAATTIRVQEETREEIHSIPGRQSGLNTHTSPTTRAVGDDQIRHIGRPQSARCGVNVAAWYDFGTVEIRYPNATLDPDAARLTVELCLRWVAAVGAGRPTHDGFLVKTDAGNRVNHRFMFAPHVEGFTLLWVKGPGES